MSDTRFAVCEGDMLLWDRGIKEPCYLFLFNDVLLVTKPKAFSTHYHLIVFANLRNKELKLEDVPTKEDLEFRLIAPKKVGTSFFVPLMTI